MSSTLDQFMFISTVTGGKSSNVQSYVQSRLRKVKWDQQQGRPGCAKIGMATAIPRKHKAPSHQDCKGDGIKRTNGLVHFDQNEGLRDTVDDELAKLQVRIMRHASILPKASSSLSSPDPFASTSLPLPTFAWKVFKWPLLAFSAQVFRAESLDFRSAALAESDFRHRDAIRQRLRLAVHDQLHMASTLLYSASVLSTWQGESLGDRPLQLLNLWTVQALRARLATLDPEAGPEEVSWLILAINSLAVSALWRRDHEAAICHVSVNRALIRRRGFHSLTPYAREAILIGDKYLALMRGQVPMNIPCRWDEACPIERGQSGTVDMSNNKLFGQDLRRYLASAGFHSLSSILEDLIHCIHVAATAHDQIHTPSETGTWIFMRHLSVVHQLVEYDAATTMDKICVCSILQFAVLISIRLGTQARGKFQAALDRVDCLTSAMAQHLDQALERKVLFWASVTLTCSAKQWNWCTQLAHLELLRDFCLRCGICMEIDTFEQWLSTCLYLPTCQRDDLSEVIGKLRRSRGTLSLHLSPSH